ncbi:MAG TPA: acetate--CoA ligase family protein [Thermomicrobiales bacterium]|nr:acetate--CoA ligase family protein [Thermomicrobiales bacterium]HRA30691.1 acetate--CoA ligase family protein [Thermomicrobiales bacterium]
MVTRQAAEEPNPGDEAIAFRRAMDALFHPKSIAIVGASQRPGFANSIQRLILKGGYEGAVYGVNPRYDEIMGCPSYPTIDAIPGGADKAIVVVPSQSVMDVLGQAERAGVKAVNIITSGFGEQADDDAAGRQKQIRDFADRTGIRIVGPNCLGIISTPAKMIAKSGPYSYVNRGPIGIVFQSGLLAYSAVLPPTDRGFGYSYIVTTGNEADLDATDFMRYYVEDDETQIIGCFIEQFRDADKLRHVAEIAADAGKPLVILKIGRSEGGQRAARAHTGSLVGSDGVIDAVMRKSGIVRVTNLDEMIETLAVFHTRKLPKADGLGTIFVSGGAGGLISDLSQDLGINLPELAPDTAERLHDIIPPYGTVGNPLDTTGQVAQQPEIMGGVLQAMAEDPNISTVVYGQAYPSKIDLDSPVGRVMKGIPDRYPDKVFLILSLVTGKMQEGFRADEPPVEPTETWDGIPFLQGAENGLRAIRSLNWYADFQRRRATAKPAATGDSVVAEQARAIVRAAGGHPLVEREAKQLLALYGIPVTGERLAVSADEAVAAAGQIGYPVVLKIESPDIAHKTEAGGVLLGVADDAAVREGYARIIASAGAYNANARITGVLVQQMVQGGREVILGMTQDPTFGPAVAVGLGGIFVEILKDVVLGAPPLTADEGREMLGQLRGRAILEGARGAAPADLDTVAGIIERFSRLCLDLRHEVAEIDINPLLVFDEGQGACVVDCLIVPSDGAASGGKQNGAS